MDSNQNVNDNEIIERKIEVYQQDCFTKIISYLSLIFFLVFLFLACLTFVLIIEDNDLSTMEPFIITTSIFLVAGMLNGILAICLIQRNEKRRILSNNMV